jgi:hypothetical protein
VRTYSDTELIEFLGELGVPLDAYSLVGDAPHDLPVIWLPDVGFRYLTIEDSELARATLDFLARRGARRFRNDAELQPTAHRERWAGWEQHAPGGHPGLARWLYERREPPKPAIRELALSPLLRECFLRTETVCVRGCCGLDAFDPDAAVIRAWAGEVGTVQAAEALRELRALIAATEDRGVVASSTFLNACTPDEASREELLGFFRAFEAALAACV